VNNINRCVRAIRQKNLGGALKTGIALVGDLYFDWHHKTNTVRRYDLEGEEGLSQNREFAVPYTAARVQGVRKCLRALDPPTTGGFVDLGCGKGRALLLAAEFGFSNVVGVEFCEPLCRIARENYERYRAKTGVLAEVRVVHADVAQYEIEDDQTVFFMFNPFGAPVLAEVVNRIEASWRREPRALWLIYNRPVHQDEVTRSGFLRVSREYRFWATSYAIYEPATMRAAVSASSMRPPASTASRSRRALNMRSR
jgi:SAM-dependent methyltransferase